MSAARSLSSPATLFSECSLADFAYLYGSDDAWVEALTTTGGNQCAGGVADTDGDGFAPPADCAEGDPAINPGAVLAELNPATADVLLFDALDKLEHDILAKTDGCAESGEPDHNDWVTGCDAQAAVYAAVLDLMDTIAAL